MAFKNTSSGQPARSATIASEDVQAASRGNGRRFSNSARPVIRWVKGDNLDDSVTRAAIAQATRLLGSAVDYCLCTTGEIEAARARDILAWADQPVEWWPLSEQDNPSLAQALSDAGYPLDHDSHWWAYFPERVRPDAPEWILHGDRIITAKPIWFDAWMRGTDAVRWASDERDASANDPCLKSGSALISLPPRFRHLDKILEALSAQPLQSGQDGCRVRCEQPVIAAALQTLGAQPIPLGEFPRGCASEDHLDFGADGDSHQAWGYHFCNATGRTNPHFARLTDAQIIFSKPDTGILSRFHWLGNTGQWGIPGWTMRNDYAQYFLERAKPFVGRPTLELGTSRGRLAAMLGTLGCQVTTVDHQNRGAAANLNGLPVQVVIDDAVNFLTQTQETFDLIVIDLHGNTVADWQRYARPILQRLKSGGTLFLNNAALYEIPEWREETGVRWFLNQFARGWKVEIHTKTLPGFAIVTSS